jgi:hypothetical protein
LFYGSEAGKLQYSRKLTGTLEKYHKVFQEIPKGLPPSRDHEHQIELILEVLLLVKGLVDIHISKKERLRKWYNTCWMWVLFNQARVPFQHQ